MKRLNELDRAFGSAPPEIGHAVEAAFMRGEMEMKKRHKWAVSLGAAAAVVALLAVGFANERATPDNSVVAPISTPEPQEPVDFPVYYTAQGRYYHGFDSCMGMVGATQHTVQEAEDAEKLACPVCQPGRYPEDYELFLSALGMEIGDLYPGYAYAYMDNDAGAWVLARMQPDGEDAPALEIGCADTENGRALNIDLTPEGAWENLLDKASNPVASMCGADYAALTRSLGLDCPGLDGARGYNMALMFDDSGALTELRLTLAAGDNYYTPVWRRDGEAFKLALTDFAQGSEPIDLEFTMRTEEDEGSPVPDFPEAD